MRTPLHNIVACQAVDTSLCVPFGAAAVFGLGSLVMMVAGIWSHQAGEFVDFHNIRNAQALAGFGAGFKVLYFLRGMDFASFLINMLENIIYGACVVDCM